MSRLNHNLLKDLIPILISILIFSVLYLSFSLEAGIYASIGFNALVLLIYRYTAISFPKLLFIDTVFLLLLGPASILSEYSLFIKLKPVFLEFIIVNILWFSTYRRKNYILELSARYVRGLRIIKNAPLKRGTGLWLLILILILHLLILLYSAIYMRTAEWAFMSTIVPYIILLVFVSYGYFRDKKDFTRLSGKEILPIVDEYGTVTGKKSREESHFNPAGKYMHPVVHLHVFNSKGELYLQKRPDYKEIQPGKWDTAVGGHIGWGEALEEGLRRETFEEIGLSYYSPELVANYIWETEAEKELVYVFKTTTDIIPAYNSDELSDGRFWSRKEIEENLERNIFTPNLTYELEKFIFRLG